jgi:hypothetical protein
MSLIFHDDEQGSDGWKAARRAVITGSRFRDARERLKSGELSAKAKLYAQDLARERLGGSAMEVYQNSQMRFGTEQEPLARAAYVAATGNEVQEVGFISTEDGKFGVSPDGLVGDDGAIEVKTICSSDVLFKVLVDGDVSQYIDQINGYMWLLGLEWVDLCVWVPDLVDAGMALTIKRIHRDETAIEELESDLIAFERLVSQYEAKLRALIEPVRLAA